MKNFLYESASEGIFMFKGGNSLIYDNQISRNYDGVILNQSFPDFKYNKIRDNRENGLMLLRNSEPQIQFNEISNNRGVGLYIRDISEPEIKANRIEANQIDFTSENKSVSIGHLQMNNTLGSNLYNPHASKCRIF